MQKIFFLAPQKEIMPIFMVKVKKNNARKFSCVVFIFCTSLRGQSPKQSIMLDCFS